MLSTSFRMAFAVLAIATLAAPCPSAAQAYPVKTVRIVDVFPPGGGTDVVGRVIASKLSPALGQSFVVENRPGAAGQLAVIHVQSQPADGHTLVIGAIGQLAISQVVQANLPFHPTRTLVPLTLLGSYWLAIAGSMHHGIGSLKREFLHYSRSPAELALMRAIKQAMDPNGILNPGKVL